MVCYNENSRRVGKTGYNKTQFPHFGNVEFWAPLQPQHKSKDS